MKLECLKCKKEFVRYISKSNLARGKGLYCTRGCYNSIQTSRPSKAKMPQWSCLICASSFKQYRRNDEPRLYCSKKCLGVANGRRTLGQPRSTAVRRKLSRAFRGDRSHFWKGGVTALNAIARESVEYKLWRESVLKRDGYRCTFCASNKQLQADHIKQFAFYPELRFAIDNGRTLCEPCHRSTPTWGNNGYKKQQTV